MVPVHESNRMTPRCRWLDRNTAWESYKLPPNIYPSADMVNSNWIVNHKSWTKLTKDEKDHYGGEATKKKFRKPNALEIIDELQHFTLFWQRYRAHPQLVGWRKL